MAAKKSGFDAVLARYNERSAKERKFVDENPEELIRRPDDFLLAVGEPTARFLCSLIEAREAKRILELGTSYGFSTLFFADVARRIGGKVTSIDLKPEKQDYAKEQLAEAGLGDEVEFVAGNVLEVLETLEGPFDFVLLDIWKQAYIPALRLLLPRLAHNGLIAADNIMYPEITRPEAKAYRQAVRATRRFETMLLPIGQGVELSCLWR